MVYQRAGAEMQDAMISLGGYYKADTWEATARLGLHSWAIGYQQQFKDKLVLMADIEGSLMQVSEGRGKLWAWPMEGSLCIVHCSRM